MRVGPGLALCCAFASEHPSSLHAAGSDLGLASTSESPGTGEDLLPKEVKPKDKFNVERLERVCWSGSEHGYDSGEHPAIGYLHLVDQTVHKNAACLDGSPPGFYLYPAPALSPNQSKWFIYFQGGGHCNFWRSDSHAFNCHGRRDSGLGSTLYDERIRDFSYKEVFLRNHSMIPTWHDWNIVFMRYCDGQAWTSSIRDPYVDGSKPPLYFRGVPNVAAIIQTLLSNHGLNAATDVVAYGCSSGAIGVTANANLMRSLLSPDTFFAAIADSGLYPDFSAGGEEEDSSNVPAEWRASFHPRGVLKNFHRQSILSLLMPDQHRPANVPLARIWHENISHNVALDRGCIERLTAVHGKLHAALFLCGVVAYSAPHVSAPLFMLNSKFDVFVLKAHAIEASDGKDPEALADVNYYGEYFVWVARRLLAKKQAITPGSPFGLLIDSCLHHCEWWGRILYSNNLTNSEAFTKWYIESRTWWEGGSHSAVPYMVQITDEQFPCKHCCLTNWSASVAQYKRIRR